ncbi:MAG TPA: malto-oligosyltrehalose synthase [Kofleriaceae bacterium]|nr:malto-oligosyltrehalose synthase [Kofleriaceae bacterium]
MPKFEPRASYRLQLHAGFTFADALAAVPYFAELGISHLYLSPILTAAEGSTHGYDVVDPDRVSPVLGGDEGLKKLVDAAQAAGIGILLDIVPNHMSIAGHANQWWLDVLENGPSSYYAHHFDVDWASTEDRVLLPILTERYGRAIQNGAIKLVSAGNGFGLEAGDVELPMAPHSIGHVVRRAADRIDRRALAALHGELAFIGDSLLALPRPHHGEVEARRRRHRDRKVLLGRLYALANELPASVALADELAAINSDPAELDTVLEMQAYRLAHWSVSTNQLSYRRFFDINTLVAIRNELPDVFEASHARILQLVEEGVLDGLRIDHVDGLRDPEEYLQRLRERAPDAWIVVEKILTADETLPATWPIDGTTGYDFAEKLGGLFVDPESEAAMTRLFEDYTGQPWNPHAGSRAARHEVMSDALHSELARLTELAVRACSESPTCRDYTRTEIETALGEILAGYPVYRTYLTESRRSEIDRARIAAAAATAADERPDLDRDLLAFLEATLAFEIASEPAKELARSAQQVTGAITAKGDEDTLLYRQVRLLARNDVGAELRSYAHSPSALQHFLASAKPRTLLATSTHDTKRSEDVRARIAVLSEIPDAWARVTARWRERTTRNWGDVEPDRVIEYAIWQTLVGAWPVGTGSPADTFPRERLGDYVRKATREARLRTSWRKPDAAYDAAIEKWLDGIYADPDVLTDIARFAQEIAPHGDRNSLAQLLIKLTAPGVPDFYQGTELRDDSLVDPDNRRAVDLAARQDRLRTIGDSSPGGLVGDLGAQKLWTIRRVLGLRRKVPARFLGAYKALDASGPHAHRVFAFMRGTELVAIVPRLTVRAEGWRDTALDLPTGTWTDVLSDQQHSGGRRALADLWRSFPIALLTRTQ